MVLDERPVNRRGGWVVGVLGMGGRSTSLARLAELSIAVAGQLFVVSAAAGAEIYKCDAGGRVVYQAVPCPGDGRAVKIWPSPSTAGRTTLPNDSGQRYRNYLQREYTRITELERLDDLAQSRQVAVGMTQEQVIKAWGSPTSVNTDINRASGGTTAAREQWVYQKDDDIRADYVYFREGRVTSIQLRR